MNETTTSIDNWGIVGHENIISTFQVNIKSNKLSHAYLFVGPKSLGKMTVAKKLAQVMHCEDDTKPCGECRSCKSILENHNQDIFVIEKDKVKIDDIREMQKSVSLKSFSGKSKIVIIDNIDSFTQEAANSILKILEEPKGKLSFVLIASSLENVIPTIVSRCVRINFNLVPTEKIESALAGKIDENYRVEVARKSTGRPGVALNYLEDKSLIDNNEELESTLNDMITQSFAKSLQATSKWKGPEVEIFLDVLMTWYRDLLFYKLQSQNLIINISNIERYYSKIHSKYSIDQLKNIISDIVTSRGLLAKNANTKLVLENLILKIKI